MTICIVGILTESDPKGAQEILTAQTPPCSRTVPWSKHLFSPYTNIQQLDGGIPETPGRGLDVNTPFAAPLQFLCTPSLPDTNPTPTANPTHRKNFFRTDNNKLIRSSGPDWITNI